MLLVNLGRKAAPSPVSVYARQQKSNQVDRAAAKTSTGCAGEAPIANPRDLSFERSLFVSRSLARWAGPRTQLIFGGEKLRPRRQGWKPPRP